LLVDFNNLLADFNFLFSQLRNNLLDILNEFSGSLVNSLSDGYFVSALESSVLDIGDLSFDILNLLFDLFDLVDNVSVLFFVGSLIDLSELLM